MSTPTIHIKRENGALMRRQGGADWVPMTLAPEPLLKLVAELSSKRQHAELELSLEDLRKIGDELRVALFGEEGQMGYGGRLHLVPEGDGELIDLVCKLPWQLMTRKTNRNFLSRDRSNPAIVTFDADPKRGQREDFEHIRFPNYPEIVMIIPRTKTGGTSEEKVDDTEAAAHEEELKRVLETYYATAEQKKLLHFLTQFNQLEKCLASSGPKLIYFYGHGRVNGNSTELLFDAEKKGRGQWHRVDDIRALLDPVVQNARFPPVAWINACNAGSARLNSAVRALSGACCSVVASRTIAYVEDARAIARIAIPAIAIQGHEPASAIRNALIEQPRAVNLGRWANTIVSVQYGKWSALAPETRGTSDVASLGDFPMRVDREEPLAKVIGTLQSAISAGPDQATSFVWRGSSNDGLDVFEQRVSDAVREAFYEYPVTVWRIELNPASGPKFSEQRRPYPNPFFSECLLHGLNPDLRGEAIIGNREAILRELFQSLFEGGPAIVVLEHGPLTRVMEGRIAAYLEYWKSLARVLGLGKEKRVHVILGFSIEDSIPEKSGEQDRPNDLRLGVVSPHELADYFKRFGVHYGILGPDLIQDAVADVMDLTAGAFRPIHEELISRLNNLNVVDGRE